jgi:hypothetical protein
MSPTIRPRWIACPSSGRPPESHLELVDRKLYGWCIRCDRWVRITTGAQGGRGGVYEVFFRHAATRACTSDVATRIARFNRRRVAYEEREDRARSVANVLNGSSSGRFLHPWVLV